MLLWHPSAFHIINLLCWVSESGYSDFSDSSINLELLLMTLGFVYSTASTFRHGRLDQANYERYKSYKNSFLWELKTLLPDLVHA